MENIPVVLAYPTAKSATTGYEVREPSPTYDPTATSSTLSLTQLQDALETHLAQYHYHLNALLSLASHPDACDSREWELGAHTLGRELQTRSHELIEQLSQAIRAETKGIPRD